MKTYTYNIATKTPLFGKVLARNVRKARKLLRTILNVRALPNKSMVWAEGK